MTVYLRSIDMFNWQAVARLKVREDQRGFVAANSYSLAQAHYDPWLVPMAIYADGQPVGFTMFTACPEPEDPDGAHWIYRLMVDQDQQGKGYGRKALELILDRLRQDPECRLIRLSYEPENKGAEQLYLSLGFRSIDRIIDGEVVLSLTVHP